MMFMSKVFYREQNIAIPFLMVTVPIDIVVLVIVVVMLLPWMMILIVS